MRRFVAIVMLAGLVAAAGACGGTDFRAATAGTTTTTTAVPAATEQQFIAAAAAGLRSSPDKPAGITDSQIRCLSGAMVRGIGVARLRAAGVTVTRLRDPNYDLPRSVAASMPTTARERLGALVQACHLGTLLAPLFAKSAAGSGFALNRAETACIATEFDRPSNTLLAAAIILLNGADKASATAFANLLVDCLSFGRIIAAQAPFPMSAAEISCIDRAARGSTAIRRALADKLSGGSGDFAAHEALVETITRCLTPQHLQQLGRSGIGSLTS